MAKHGIFTQVGETEEFLFTPKTGLESVTTAITNPFKPSEGIIGTPKLLSHVAALAVGNMVAVNSIVGGIGISGLGRTVKFA